MKPHRIWIIAILFLAAALKAGLVAWGRLPFNADEAVVALMARHILHGARPIFFYGQAYMGSLDAFLVAAGFAVFGQAVWVIRLVQTLLYLGVLLTTLQLGRRAFGRWETGLLAMLLLAVPTVNVTLYTTVSLGGYGEALLIGNLILLAALRLQASIGSGGERRAWRGWLWIGFLSGLGLWAFGLTLVYSLPALLYLVWTALKVYGRQSPRRLAAPFGVLIAGGLVGSAPWWTAALQGGLGRLLGELGGGAIAGVETLSWGARIVRRLFSLFLLGGSVTFGLRPPWDIAWLALPLLPFALVFWLAVCVDIIRRVRGWRPQHGGAAADLGWLSAQRLLAGSMLALLLAFALTPFGADPSGRYFIPLAAPLTLFAAAFILDLRRRFGRRTYALAALVIAFNLYGTLQCAARFPPGISTQFYAPAQVDQRNLPDLIAFLREHGETRGYTNYWVAYPLAFLSGEELVFVPRLPYHLDFSYTPRDDRYAPYAAAVAAADRTAYITTHHPELDRSLRAGLAALGVTWQERRIGDFQVFYALSRPVRPAEIGYGELR